MIDKTKKTGEWQKYSYWIVLLVTSLILFLLIFHLNINELIIKNYLLNENYTTINNYLFTFFITTFGFIFTIIAIIFGLSKESLFMILVKKNEKNKKDVLNYFFFQLLFSLFILAAIFIFCFLIDNVSLSLIKTFLNFLIILIGISSLNLFLLLVLIFSILRG